VPETVDGLPVLNPRDLLDDFVRRIKEVDPDAEYVLMVTDPRDHRANTICHRLEDKRKGPFLRSLALGLWEPDDDEFFPETTEVPVEEDGE
jgi:hypothetical protein